MALKITAGASPLSYDDFRKKKYTYAGGYQGYLDTQRKATENEAAKRAGANIQTTQKTLQTGQSATSQGRKFMTNQNISAKTSYLPKPSDPQYASNSSQSTQAPTQTATQTPSGSQYASNSSQSTQAPTQTATQTPTAAQSGNEYADTLISMGFNTGSISAIQKMINEMSESTAEQRVQKKKAQEALRNYSSSGGSSIFQNPLSDISSEQQYNDIEAAQAELFDDYTEKKTELESQIERMRGVEESEYQASRDQASSAISATTSQLAQGRESVESMTAPLISKQFSERVTQQLTNTRTKLNLVQEQRDRLLRDLERAYEDKNEELADLISENLAIAGNNIQKMQQEAAKQAAEANANALDFLKTDSTGMFAGMNPVDLANSMGIDIGTAGFMIRASEQKWNIAMSELDGSQIDKAYKIAQIDKMVEEAKWAGLTPEQRNYVYAQNLSGNAKNEFMDWAAKNPNFQTFKSGENVYSFNPKTGEADLIIGDDSMGIQPTGVYASAQIGSMTVTLDSAALVTFQQAYGQMSKELGDVPLQSKESFSLRDLSYQKKLYGKGRTEEELLKTGNFTPEEAALYANKDSAVVTWTLQSKHIQGLAIDFNFSGKDIDYINKVESAMKRYGWSRPLPTQDPGHFEFNGKAGTGLTSTEELQVGEISTSIFGKRAGSTPEKLQLVRESFLENGKSKDKTIDVLRIAGYSSDFKGTIKSAFDNLTYNMPLDKSNMAREMIEDKIDEYGIDSNEVKSGMLTLARTQADATTRQQLDGRIALIQNMNVLEDKLQEYVDAGGNTGLIKGNLQKITESLGQVGDPDLARIGNEIRIAIQEYRKAISGAAFTESEAKEYEAVFPSSGKVPELNLQKIQSLLNVTSRNQNSYYRSAFGAPEFESFFGGDAVQYLFYRPTQPTISGADVANKFGYGAVDNESLIDQ